MSSFYSLIFIALLVSSSATSFHETSHHKAHTRPKRINANIGQVPLASQSLSSKTVHSIDTPPSPLFLLNDQSGDITVAPSTPHPQPSTQTPTQQSGKDDLSTSSSYESSTDASATPTSLPNVNVTGNPSEIPPSTTPTTESPATTPEAPPTTEVPPRIQGFGESTKGFFCLCDLQWNVCEMNCCCDPDCSDENKKTFTDCSDSVIYNQNSKRRNDRDCVKSYIMYDYHVSYRVDRKQSGLFCVVKDNSKQSKEFSQSDMERITRRVIRKEINLKPKYTWDAPPPSVSDENYNEVGHEPYKYGSQIWTQEFTDDLLVSSHFVPLRLPTSFHKDICSIHEPVKYLQDFASSCARPISNLQTQCQTFHELDVKFYTDGYSVVINPKKMEINSTKYHTQEIYPQKECYNGHCIPSSDTDAEPFFNFRRPEWDEQGSICRNVLSRLNLTVYHGGIEGITSVVAKADLVEITQGATHVWQEFSVDFVWSKVANPITPTNNTNLTTLAPLPYQSDIKLPRSGNPGYIVGKPVILGRKADETKPVSNDSKEYTTIERIRVLADQSQWLHIQGAGDCPNESEGVLDGRKNSVLFGYEHASTCKLLLDEFEYCEQLQRHIASIFFGTDDPLSFTKAPLYVAAYGSPDAFPSDWVPLTFIGMSNLLGTSPFSVTPLINGCDGIITGVHITIAYAYVGSVDAPQAKIVGVFYEPEDSFPLPAAPVCSDEHNSDVSSDQQCRTITDLAITTTVSFMDVSGEPVTKVATWPVVSIRLPSDFYYPFSTSSPASSDATRRDIFVSLYVSFIVIIVMV